jgi:hypothetical protein
MFASKPKRGALNIFEADQYRTPGIGDEIGRLPDFNPVAGAPTDIAAMGQQTLRAPEQGGMLASAPRRKMDWGRFAADFVQNYAAGLGNPAAMAGLQSRQQDKRQEYEDLSLTRRLAAQDAQWKQRFDYERANPKPVNNDTIADYEFIKNTRGEAAANAYLDNKANPIQGVRVTNPDGSEGIQFIRPGGGSPAQSGPQPGAIEDGYRFKGGNPADPSSWEEIGGAPQAGARTFP